MSKRARIIYLTLSAVFFLVTLGCIYYLMGGVIPGINSLEVYEQEGLTRYVAGIEYKGKADTKELRTIFFKYRDWVKNDVENAKVTDEIMKLGEVDDSKRQFNFLCVIDYPTEEKKMVNQFIGVAIRGSSGELPMGDEEVREFKMSKRYSVFLAMSEVVRPPTSRVEEKIRKAAEANGDQISQFFETYYADGSMRIEGLVE